MRKVLLTAIEMLGAASLYAQESNMPVKLGFKVGIPVTDMLAAKNTSEFDSLPGSYTSAVPRYEFGVSGEFKLPMHLRFEIDGLVKRGGVDSGLPLLPSGSLAYRPTSCHNW